MRRVLEAEVKNETLRLAVQRLGQSRAGKLEIFRERDHRTPSAKRLARLTYQRSLQRTLQQWFPSFQAAPLRTSMDLERSFGPIYSRGLLHRGQSAFAVLGVNAQEAQASIDAALTFAILWLDVCRQSQAGKFVVEGVKLFLPAGTVHLTRERMAHLNSHVAKWHLYELEECDGSLRELDISDCGNVATRLVHSTDEAGTRSRFAAPIAQIQNLMPEAEIAILSPTEIAFRATASSLPAPGSPMNPNPFAALLKSYLGPDPRKPFFPRTISRASPNWCTALARFDIPRAPAITRCGGCIPNVGWNRS